MNYKELRNGLVHADGPGGRDYTLCGLTTENTLKDGLVYDTIHETEAEPYVVETREKVTCPDCVEIILYCIRLGKRSIGKVVQEGGDHADS